jgi:hypothetical protein
MTTAEVSEPGEGLTSRATLEAQFSGELIGPDHAEFDRVRKTANGMIDRRPVLVARCTSSRDVQAALAYARAEQLLVAVRGGGIRRRDTPAVTAAWSSTPAR